MSHFKAEIHPIRFRLWSASYLAWGAYSASDHLWWNL